MGCKSSKIVPVCRKNFETFSILWLDAEVNTTEENRQIQKVLRSTIDHLVTFEHIPTCRAHISNLSSVERSILIVSGRYCREIIPHIHDLSQLSSIYIFCKNQQKYEQWAQSFKKVVGVFVQLSDLVNKIKSDHMNQRKLIEPMSISVYKDTENLGKSTTELNGQFIHSLLLIDVLIRTKSSQKDRKDLVMRCKNAYDFESTQLPLIDKFEATYTADRAIWWYTQECFLYNMLNRALRTSDIDLLFFFRFVIRDIYCELKKNQCQSQIEVYRGQLMSNDELKILQSSIGKCFSVNSFFSTTLDCNKAIEFLKNSSKYLNRILFTIDADPQVKSSKPFADISESSRFNDEREILFMIGSIFRLIQIDFEKESKIYKIKMKLCGDNDHDMKPLFDHMKKFYGGGNTEISLSSYADVLRQMGEYDKAEEICNRLLNELSSNDPKLFDIYWLYGTICNDKGEYDASLEWFNKAYQLKMETDPNDHLKISHIFNWLGTLHRRKGQLDKALEYYNKAIELCPKENNANRRYMAFCYNNIAIVYKEQKKYNEALDFYNKILMIEQNEIPSDSPEMGAIYNNIGNLHSELGQYEQAMEYQQKALIIRTKALPPTHSELAKSHANIGLVHEKIGELHAALTNLEIAAKIATSTLSSEHAEVIEIQKTIRRIRSKLN
ncbi:hypothetical protein I4U23_013061 [Adineta vaga]|nr:hypothetical protein I4U23_013061 [Adineta vaga]